eukprot:360772-Chlamydomonas_euryale.AAC.7
MTAGWAGRRLRAAAAMTAGWAGRRLRAAAAVAAALQLMLSHDMHIGPAIQLLLLVVGSDAQRQHGRRRHAAFADYQQRRRPATWLAAKHSGSMFVLDKTRRRIGVLPPPTSQSGLTARLHTCVEQVPMQGDSSSHQVPVPRGQLQIFEDAPSDTCRPEVAGVR